MNAEFVNGWPQERLDDRDKVDRWLHNDLKTIPYLYIYLLFDKWVEIGGFKKE